MSEYAERHNALIITTDSGVGAEVQFTKTKDGAFNIEIHRPWAGSSETGFGATTDIDLSAEDVARLLKWIGK